MNNTLKPLLASTAGALFALAVPGSALGAGNTSNGVCDLSQGLPAAADTAFASVVACMQSPPEGVILRDDLAGDLVTLTNRQREKRGLEPMHLRPAFSQAAMVHGLDLATRGNLAHEDLEGRDHLFRIRLMDRTALIGQTGGVIGVFPAGGVDAANILAALMSDPVNAENLFREGFSSQGVSIIEQDGRLIVVQVLARLEGELEQPVPLTITARVDLSADLMEDNWKSTGWRVMSPDGQSLARGLNASMNADRSWDGTGGIVIEASDGQATYRLRGPLLQE